MKRLLAVKARAKKLHGRLPALAKTSPSPNGTGSMEARDHALLSLTIEVAVPIRIEQLKRDSVDVILHPAEMAELADDIAFHGDVVQFKSKKPGETASHFARLVEAIARLSYVPGGIKFNGVHYEATRSA